MKQIDFDINLEWGLKGIETLAPVSDVIIIIDVLSLGAGVIISNLKGTLSPESKSALSVFQSLKQNIQEEIKNCISGKELIEKGFEKDVELACELNASDSVAFLKDNCYKNVNKAEYY